MLSRTAGDLYWLARYMERVENLSRLIEVGYRLASTASLADAADSEWHSTMITAGCEKGFYDKHEEATAETVIPYLAADRENPSSILSCIDTARRNARSVRTALTTDMWNAVNGTWLEARDMTEADFAPDRMAERLEWVRERALLFTGSAVATMTRGDSYWFTRLGTFIERGDNTARILDVKYHVLLPTYERVGGRLDYARWSAILRAASAIRGYHHIYQREIQPWLVAEFLILRPEMPRSLIRCFDEITHDLDVLARIYGSSGECHRLAGRIHAQLKYGRIDEIYQTGLHDFLTEFIDSNINLGDEIAKHYLF